MNKKLSSPNRDKLRRKWTVIGAACLVAVGGAWGAWQYLTHPPRPWMVRWQISRYLSKNASPSGFKVDFSFPSAAEMAKAPGKDSAALVKGSRTGKDFDTLAKEYLDLKTTTVVLEREVPASQEELKNVKPHLDRLNERLAKAQAAGATNFSVLQAQVKSLQQRVDRLKKNAAAGTELQKQQQALEPIVADLWDFQRAWAKEMSTVDTSSGTTLAQAANKLQGDIHREVQEAPTYAAIYHAIGQELWVADRLLGSANPDHRRIGVRLALDASHSAVNDAVNGWLASRICEGYVWPNLDLANDMNRRSPFNLQNMLNECADIFRQSDEMPNVARTWKILLAKADSQPEADRARAQIGMAYEQSGELKDALHYLRQIQSTNDYRWILRRIPRMERQLKAGG